MRALLYITCFTSLLMSACAHLDNGFLRSAEPLKSMECRQMVSIASSYAYAPGLSVEPDSIIAPLNRREQKADISMKIPLGTELGLGRGFQIGGQVAGSIGPGFRFSGYDQTFAPTSINTTYRVYLQYSFPLENGYWIGFSPGILDHREVWGSGLNYNLKLHGRGFEYPLTFSKTQPYSELKTSSSFTFRYTKLKISSRLNVSGPSAWEQNEYEQADQSLGRYAFIYTHQLEKVNTGMFMDLGLEFNKSKRHRGGQMAPIFGIKYYFHRPCFGSDQRS